MLFRSDDFNPRSPCGERLPCTAHEPTRAKISIHAPRVGSDRSLAKRRCTAKKFQSTLPVWGATLLPPRSRAVRRFQSTLPVWGATGAGQEEVEGVSPISIHAPRVGSDRPMNNDDLTGKISIHAPRVGSDSWLRAACWRAPGFQSTLPVWGATGRATAGGRRKGDFNPRSPCGERRRPVELSST